MPRGIPNAKRDEGGWKYTSIPIPPQVNMKNMTHTYLKSDFQTIYARKNKAKNAEKQNAGGSSATPNAQGKRGLNVIVIHPGSRWLRIGRASDERATTVANLLARKIKSGAPPPRFVSVITRQHETGESGTKGTSSSDNLEHKIAAIVTSLRDRMRFYKLRITPNAAALAMSFNEKFKPEILEMSHASVVDVDWIRNSTEDIILSDKVFLIADPEKQGYVIKYPILGSKLNMRDYSSLQEVLSDVEAIWGGAIQEKLAIDRRSYKDYSVVLIIPDISERTYIKELVHLLLVHMGFKQVGLMQESLAATFGTGLTNACVVDIGAVKTSISCVDDGLVLQDTRMTLNMGGDDITEFLHVLLERISFPYKDLELARLYDWNTLEDLKARICSLTENDVALNLYDFLVRRPDRPAEKYGLRAYDEVILAPMCIFEPRVIDFEKKRINLKPTTHPDVTDEIIEYIQDRITQAMLISTQHLMPHPQSAVTVPSAPDQALGSGITPAHPPPEPELSLSAAEPIIEPTDVDDVVHDNTVQPMHADDRPDVAENSVAVKQEDNVEGKFRTDINEIAFPDNFDLLSELGVPAGATAQVTDNIRAANFLGGYPIDVIFEASKLPLDVAIFNSARAAGGDDKIRKYLQAVLVVGGTGCLSGMTHALESRLQAIATRLVPNMEKVQIIPPAKGVDPREVIWKGGSVLAKLDGAADLWVEREEWDILGMRAVKDRCFIIQL